jgi:dienelactone hydrolase
MLSEIKTKLAFTAIAVSALGACQTTQSTGGSMESSVMPSTIEYDGKEIVKNNIHELPGYANYMQLNPMKSQVPSYDGKGLLAVSWNPSPDAFNNPTYVIMHGGHGVGRGMWIKAKELRKRYNANVLLLDSFKARGLPNNWHRGAKADAIVRTFDVIAIGKWLKVQGTDPKKTYMMGGSQGGWTTLKAMSAEPTQIAEVKPLYAGGVAYYPVCDNYNREGNLRPEQRFISLAEKGFWGPVLLLTGKKDFATRIEDCQQTVVKHATKHVSFERGTHGWEIRWRENGEMNKDGSCRWSGNRNFKTCYDEDHTEKMYVEIGQFTTKTTEK